MHLFPKRLRKLLIAILIINSILIMSVHSALGQAAGENKDENLDLQILLTKKQAFDLAFPGADKVKREKHWTTAEERTKIGEICLQEIKARRFNFYVGKKGGKPMGYALIDHIIGKSFPITFITMLNVDGSVKDIEIMVYREPRGWEVKYESFLSQFFGKNALSDYREINSITGATLSVRAVISGVSKAAAAYKVLYLDKK